MGNPMNSAMPGVRFITRGLSLSWAIQSWLWQFNAYRIDMYYYHVHKNQWCTFIDPLMEYFPKQRHFCRPQGALLIRTENLPYSLLWDSLWFMYTGHTGKRWRLICLKFIMNYVNFSNNISFASEPEWVNRERGGALPDMIQALEMESETFCWFGLLLSIFSIWTIHSLNYILWHCFQLSLGLSQKKHDSFWEILRVSCLYFYKFAGHLVVYHLTKTRSEKRLIQVMSSSQQQAWRCPRLPQMVKNGQLPSTLVFKVAWLQAPVRVIHLQGNLRRKFRKIVLRWNGKIRKEKMFQYRLNTFFLYHCNKLRGLLWFPTRCQ